MKWRMVTSWPKRLPGPGMSAERIADRIRALSGGRIDITRLCRGRSRAGLRRARRGRQRRRRYRPHRVVLLAGQDAGGGVLHHGAIRTDAGEHVAWVDAGGGQALWDELYAPFGVKPFMGGNTGVCMGGWFRRELKSLADLHGLKLRSLGLGGEVYRRLGATPQTTPPAEILTSLQSGVLDAAEFVGPGSDIALGLYRVAPFYYYPGFNKPNGTGECIVARKVWEPLPADLKAIVAHACAAEANFALAEMERLNAVALVALTTQHGVTLAAFPDDLVAAARKEPSPCSANWRPRRHQRQGARSYVDFRERTAPWSRVSIEAVLRSRGI